MNGSKWLSAGTFSLWLGIVSCFGSVSHLHANENRHGTGLIPYSAAEWQELEMNTLKVVGVRPSKIGLQRLQKYLKEQGKPPLQNVASSSLDDEFITSLEWSPQTLKIVNASSPVSVLPSSVNNSTLACFPPVGNQGSLGSCVAWATTYYGGTHELGLINGYNNKTSSAHILSPKWTYNLVNWGMDGGTFINYGYQLLSQNGAASIVQFPYDSNYLSWDLNPQDWIAAISNRMQNFVMVPGLGSPQDLSVIKGMLNNGHILSIGTYIDSWNFTAIKADPANPSSPYVGQMACTYMNGRSGGHNISIVGYDDNIWIDINGNGQVDSGERGAFLMCNSWGTSWGNKGFVWVSYDAFLQTSAVPNGPSAGRVGISQDFGNQAFAQVAKAPNYHPSLVGQFTLSQTLRNQIVVQGGIGGPNAAVPVSVFQDMALSNSGGPYAFNGTTVANPISGTFALDFTDLIPASSTAGPQKYMLQLGDTVSGNPTGLTNFSLIDLLHSKTLANTQPISVDNGTQYPFITYDFYNQNIPDTTPPNVSITSPANGSTVANTIEVIASATDNVAVAKVEFYVDNQLQVTDTASPYTFSLDTTKLSNGTHNLSAIAYDTSNNTASFSISVNVQNADTTPPTVTITSIANGSTVSGTIQIVANAMDNVGISKVELYVDGQLQATDTAFPYVFNLDTTKLSNGEHGIVVFAYDTSNNSASYGIWVIVQNGSPDKIPPQVAITSPVNGAILSKTVLVSATASDNVEVSRVVIQAGPGVTYSSSIPPYAFNWDTTQWRDQDYTITATAYDTSNNSTTTSITVTVQNDAIPPQVAFTSPANGAVVSKTIQVSLSASDNVGVTRVDLLLDNGTLFTIESPPYAFSVNTTQLQNGNHTLTATAYDFSNNTSSSTITVNVQN